MFPSNKNNSKKCGSAFQAPKKTYRIVCFLCHFFLHFSQFTAVNLFIWAQDPWHDHSLVLRSEDQGIWGGKKQVEILQLLRAFKMMPVMPVAAPPFEAIPSLDVRGIAAEDVLEVGMGSQQCEVVGTRKTQGFFCRWRCLDKVSVYFRWLNLCRIMW